MGYSKAGRGKVIMRPRPPAKTAGIESVVRVSRSHWYPQTPTCSGHAAVLFWAVCIGLFGLGSDFALSP